MSSAPWRQYRLYVAGVGDNSAMHQHLLTKFLHQSSQQLASITSAQFNDVKSIADVAHALKSAARTVGAMALGGLCEQIEIAGQT